MLTSKGLVKTVAQEDAKPPKNMLSISNHFLITLELILFQHFTTQNIIANNYKHGVLHNGKNQKPIQSRLFEVL